MQLTKKSLLTGIEHTLELPITEEEYATYRNGNRHIQYALPQLTPAQREFVISGITEEEWDKQFGKEEDEN